MENYDDKIILDDDVEVAFSSKEQDTNRQAAYSNKNVSTYGFFETAFSKKYLALTFATISIFLLIFMKFMFFCGVNSTVFFALMFFLTASLCFTAIVINIVNFAKNKKVELNVSSIISFISLLLLFLI